jgi:hypothetical protein
MLRKSVQGFRTESLFLDQLKGVKVLRDATTLNITTFSSIDTQHNGTQHNDTQLNDTQHNGTQHNDIARDKHSSLLRKSVNYSRNKFYSTGPWSFVILSTVILSTVISSIVIRSGCFVYSHLGYTQLIYRHLIY